MMLSMRTIGAAPSIADLDGDGRKDLLLNGFWLAAPLHVRMERVTARRRDASDATADVAQWQEGRLLGPGAAETGWTSVDAGGTVEDTVAAVLQVGLPSSGR